MPNRPQRFASRRSSARLAMASRALSATSGAMVPRFSNRGSAGVGVRVEKKKNARLVIASVAHTKATAGRTFARLEEGGRRDEERRPEDGTDAGMCKRSTTEDAGEAEEQP